MAPVHSCATGRVSTLHDARTQRCANRAGARRLQFTRPMPDPDTSRIPREELLGLLSSASNIDQERITAPMPVARLDELLAPEQIGSEAVARFDEIFAPEHGPQGSAPALDLASLPDLVIRFRPNVDPLTSSNMTITIVSFALTLMLGLLLLLLF